MTYVLNYFRLIEFPNKAPKWCAYAIVRDSIHKCFEAYLDELAKWPKSNMVFADISVRTKASADDAANWEVPVDDVINILRGGRS